MTPEISTPHLALEAERQRVNGNRKADHSRMKDKVCRK